MRFSVFAAAATPFTTPEGLTALAVEAEERGFATLWVPEHVVLFDEYRHEYPYAADGTLPAPSDSGLLEPFTVLAHLAAVTSPIRLATAICLCRACTSRSAWASAPITSAGLAGSSPSWSSVCDSAIRLARSTISGLNFPPKISAQWTSLCWPALPTKSITSQYSFGLLAMA